MAIDLQWGDERKWKFVTNVGLITTNGPNGQNVTSAEWTHHVSYSPGMIAVVLGPGKASTENIEATKEFGVNLAAVDQNVLASVAGNSGKTVDKIALLKELGYKFSKAKKINTYMVDGAAFQAECKVKEIIKTGSHITFIGEIVELYPLSDKMPLLYTNHAFFEEGKKIEKPDQAKLDKIAELLKKHAKKQ